MILIIDTEKAEQQGFMLMKHQCTADGCARVKANWEELPDGWISVKDEMPPPSMRVLCFCKAIGRVDKVLHNCMAVDWRYNGGTFGGIDDSYSVTHWMPLPKSPKEGRT